MTEPKIDIPEPWLNMLYDLQDIPGFKNFQQFVLKRWTAENGSIKAEIKALFEMYHMGILKEICSFGNSMPEGIIEMKVKDKLHKGIIEVAFVEWFFMTNQSVLKEINIATNVRKGTYFSKTIPSHKLIIKKDHNGTIIQGQNADLSVKISRLYETKRKQHSKTFADFPEYVKIYYFLVNSPPEYIGHFFKSSRLLNNLKPGEILILCTQRGSNKHSILTFIRGVEASLEIENPYFGFDE